MLDEDKYKETFSALHASEHTLTEVMERIEQNRCKKKHFAVQWAAVFAVVLVLASTVVYAAGRMRFGGWPIPVSGQEVRKRGFNYPEQLGEYSVDVYSASSMHIVPPQSSALRAWFWPNYVWTSINYKKGCQRLTVCFGKTDHPLWYYCFDYDESTGVWMGAQNLEEYEYASVDYADSAYHIENVTEHSYKGCTIYAYDGVWEYSLNEDHPDYDLLEHDDMKDFPLTCTRDAYAQWVDYETGICFDLRSYWDWDTYTYMREEQGMTQEELLGYVKEIIDLYR